MVSYRVIGKPTPHPEGSEKVSGGARYTADVHLPGTLWAKILRSPYPHARITHIDTSRAARLPGIQAVLTGEDVRGILFGRRYRDVPVLAQDRARFVGEPVAAVAAEDAEIADRAVELIDVTYEGLPYVVDPVEAMAEGAPILHPDVNSYVGLPERLEKPSNAYAHDTWERGNVEQGFASADLIVENTFTVPRVHQAYMEPHTCLVWIDEEQRVQVWTSSKAPYSIKETIAAVMDSPQERVRVNPVTIGGDFGGKGAALHEPLCYFLALRSGRPVKLVTTYVEELTAGSPRHAGVIRLKTGVNRDGTMVAYQVDAVLDGGAYGGLRPGASMGGAGHGASCYRIANARIDVTRVYTNNIPGGQMRAPGEPQGYFAAESHIDCVARSIGMDPLEFRLKNLIEGGDETLTGTRYQEVKAKETLRAAAEVATYAAPKAANIGRGMAISYRGPGGGESAVGITLTMEGEAIIHTAALDQGTGTYTTLRQVVAEELGLPPERLRIDRWDTDEVPFDSGIGGSRGTRIVTGSAFKAAQEVKAELAGLAAEVLGWPEEAVTVEGDEIVRQDTGERQRWDALLTRVGRPIARRVVNSDTERSSVTGFTAQIAEVAVDRETGTVTLLKLSTVHDVGMVLNPVGHQGQINGAVVQGVGYAMMEELSVEEGVVQNGHFGEYKIPTVRDIPELQTVLLEPAEGVGPYNIKGIGENPLTPVAPAIANAVEDAVGVRVRDLPITAEKVYRALHENE